MADLTLRTVKGSSLTHLELDANFTALDSDITAFKNSTNVVAGTYGSASEVPVFRVNSFGQIDSATTVTVAGVSSFDFDSNTGSLTINTADGGSFTEVLTLDPYTTTTLAEGDNLYYTIVRADSDARYAVSVTDAGGDGSFSYNPATGVFTYTGPSATEVRAHFSASNGVSYSSATGAFQAVESEINHDTLFNFVANEHIDHTTVTMTAGAGLLGGGTIAATREFKVDSASIATVSTSQTLTNKTISGSNNTLSNIANASLTNSSITINGTAVSLGGTRTLVTDDISEDGSPANLWFTTGRARQSISHIDNGGDGSLSYDNSTGVISYTGPSASEVRAHFSAGNGIKINSGVIATDSSSSVTFSGLTVTNNVLISGNLQVDGTTTTVSTENLEVTDNMIYLNAGESDGSPTLFIDIGFAGNRNDTGSYAHTGLFRDATDGIWKFFDGYIPEPDAALQINTAHASYSEAPVQGSKFISSTTSGAPIEVSSNQKVINLNADLLDSQEGSYYLDYNNQTNRPSRWAASFMLMGA
jgi:hypothetical protein